jgi:sulfate adenylyltransferase (ADP) / ATP adenylyltransferase
MILQYQQRLECRCRTGRNLSRDHPSLLDVRARDGAPFPDAGAPSQGATRHRWKGPTEVDRGGQFFVPGTLLQRAARQWERARQAGALEPFATTERTVVDGGVRFVVRRAENRARKPAGDNRDEAGRAAKSNPFIDYDPRLFVADVSATHVCLLNKFPVMASHLLIVTRTPESQESLLTPRDFEALSACLAETEGLGFYNGGKVAGASQPHKHLQLVPLPISREGPALPMETVLAAARQGCLVDAVPGAPFHHAFAWLDPTSEERPLAAAVHDVYRGMLDALFPAAADGEEKREQHQPGPYNLLVTRRWMLMVPRSAEQFASIPVNALGYAGSFFIWSDAQADALLTHGPMTVLAAVALPRVQP